MTLIAFVADSHFWEDSRFEECVRLHDWIANDARARGVHLLGHAGDVYERKSTPKERNAVAAWVTSVASFCPVVIVRGNHDPEGDLRILGELKAKYTITVEEGAAVHKVEASNGATVTVACLAWPRKSALLAAFPNVGHEEAGQVAHDALRAVLRGFAGEVGEHASHGLGPQIFLAHAMVRGSITSTGQPLVGGDMEIGLEDLALAKAQLYALGHIHKGQSWDIDGAPVVYPGSPRRTAFGESEAKGYTVANFDDNHELVSCEFVEAPATPMVDVCAEWGDSGWRFVPPIGEDHSALVGAEVRLRYTTPADAREAARDAALATRANMLDDGGAVSVKVEEIVTTATRARAPEVSAAKTLEQKLEAQWKSKGFDPAEARRARLLSLANGLETAS